MTWLAGMVLVIALATLVPWAVAELLDLGGRRWIRRVNRLSAGRRAQGGAS